jgi:hypothetical protein
MHFMFIQSAHVDLATQPPPPNTTAVVAATAAHLPLVKRGEPWFIWGNNRLLSINSEELSFFLLMLSFSSANGT